MPPRRTESHSTSAQNSTEAVPSIIDDTAYLKELLAIARGINVRNARPASGSATTVGDAASLNTSVAASPTGRPVSRSSAGAEPEPAPLEALVPATEEDIVYRLVTMLLRCREVRQVVSTTATPASSSSASSPSVPIPESTPQAYWTDLALQIRVDQLVEVVRYCASHDFPPLKTRHVLSWWLWYQALVCSGVEGDVICAPPRPSPAASERAGSGAAAGRTNTASPTSGSTRKGHAASASSAAPLGKANSRSTSATSPSNRQGRGSDAGVEEVAMTSPTSPAATAAVAKPYLEVLAEQLRQFALDEVEAWWRWELVPRQPKERDPALIAAVGPATNGKNGSAGGSGGGGNAGKKKMTERTRLLLQMEEEEEEKRLAAIASLPAENIFLNESEVEAFVTFFVQHGWLPHTHLYRILTCHEAARSETSSEQICTGVPPLCPSFDLVVEQPAPVPLLATATVSELSAIAMAELEMHTALSGPPVSGATAAATVAAASTAAVGSGVATAASAVAPSGKSASGKAGGPQRARSNTNTRKPDLAGAPPRNMSDSANNEENPAAETAPTKTPLAALHAQQETELALFEKQRAEWCARKAEEARLGQLERDMELHFDREGTDQAVRDVYQGLEDHLTDRELQILKRVEALEVTLGMRAAPDADVAGAEAAATGKPSSRGGNSKRGGGGRSKK